MMEADEIYRFSCECDSKSGSAINLAMTLASWSLDPVDRLQDMSGKRL